MCQYKLLTKGLNVTKTAYQSLHEIKKCNLLLQNKTLAQNAMICKKKKYLQILRKHEDEDKQKWSNVRSCKESHQINKINNQLKCLGPEN